MSNWVTSFPESQVYVLALFNSLGVAGIAGLAVVNITGDMVMNPIHSALAVGMTVDTGKYVVIGG